MELDELLKELGEATYKYLLWKNVYEEQVTSLKPMTPETYPLLTQEIRAEVNAGYKQRVEEDALKVSKLYVRMVRAYEAVGAKKTGDALDEMIKISQAEGLYDMNIGFPEEDTQKEESL